MGVPDVGNLSVISISMPAYCRLLESLHFRALVAQALACVKQATISAPILLLLLFHPAPAQSPSTDAKLEFENAWVRIVRVHYNANEKTAIHDHPPTPTVYVYTTDGGRLRIGHPGETPVIRPPVSAGGIRFQRGVLERHQVEELDGVASEYIRVELKTKPVDLPQVDVRRAPNDHTPYESGMIRILRVTCPPKSACPMSTHNSDPAVLIMGHDFRWVDPGSPAIRNTSDALLEQVRIELVSPPAASTP